MLFCTENEIVFINISLIKNKIEVFEFKIFEWT